MTDHASVSAAVTAGYIKTQTDRGVGFKGGGRYWTQLEKYVNEGEAGGFMLRAHGESSVDQPTADTNALAALNGQRNVRYGTGASAGKNAKGTTLTFDN